MISAGRAPGMRASWWLLFAVSAAAGCGSAGSMPRSCQVDADCGGGAICRSGTCQATLQLAIESPANGTSTHGTVHVVVSVQGGSPSAVELLATAGGADTRLAAVGPPYTYDWDTRSMSEGAYALRARVSAGAAEYDSQPVSVVVDRTGPPAPTIAAASPTGAQPVPVAGTAEASATVTVYEGATVLAQVAANTAGAWSASIPLSDGTHELTATATDAAENVSPASAVAEVTCVRRNPTVMVRAPAPAARNVWSRDPITVVFSRVMSHATVEASLRYLVDGQAEEVSFAWADPAQDGSETLTIHPAVLPDVANGSATVAIDLSSTMTDVAGNPLTVPSDAWTWTVPDWQDLASPVASITVGSRGIPGQVGLAVGDDTVGTPYLALGGGAQRWDGRQWIAVGADAGAGSTYLTVGIGAGGNPVFAGCAWYGDPCTAQVLDGTSWNTVNLGSGIGPQLVMDANGAPTVLWDAATGIMATQWNAAAHQWTTLPSPSSGKELAAAAFLEADGRLHAVGMTFNTQASSTDFTDSILSGGTWSTGPGIPPCAYTVSKMVMHRSGAMYVIAGSNVLQRAAVGWTTIGNVGSALNALALDDAGNLYLAWQDATGITVQSWNGAQWKPLGTKVGPVPSMNGGAQNQLSFAVDKAGITAVAWIDVSVSSGPLYVKRYNR
jgi:hypothetical protein